MDSVTTSVHAKGQVEGMVPRGAARHAVALGGHRQRQDQELPGRRPDDVELRHYTRAEIVKNPPSRRMSPHDPSLKETILLVDLHGPSYITLVGIIPKTLDDFWLLAEVEAAVSLAACRVVTELEQLGVEFTHRSGPLPIAPFSSAAALPPLGVWSDGS